MKKISLDAKITKIQEKIKNADELVFIHPLWWVGPPAIMKNFIDTNFSVGFAYKYIKVPIIKGRPVGLLKGKTARIFITCDGASWMYKLVLTPFKFNWKYFILLFCGIKLKSFTLFDRMRWRSEKEKGKWLKQAYELGKK